MAECNEGLIKVEKRLGCSLSSASFFYIFIWME